jgi:glutamate formiminotransferase
MSFPLEAVPNFSEGRERASIDALVEALARHADLVDLHIDSDHNRSVYTLFGDESELIEALVAAVKVAREHIDLSAHEGVHPRVGAADVVPIVYLRPDDAGRARAAALELAGRIGSELELPVFLYGELAGGRTLAELREGGASGLERRIAAGELEPDFGPARLDPRAGAVLVAAREPIVAFNVNLRGSLESAREIAALVRERDGGYAGVRTLGLELASAGFVQVSMNVAGDAVRLLPEIVARIEREAELRGTVVVGSELVGLLPLEAALAAARIPLRLGVLDHSRLLELRALEHLGRRA